MKVVFLHLAITADTIGRAAKKVTIDALPLLSEASPEAATAAVEHASAKKAVARMADDFLSKVFPNSSKDLSACLVPSMLCRRTMY